MGRLAVVAALAVLESLESCFSLWLLVLHSPNVKKLHDWMRPVVTLSHCVGQCVQSHVGVLFGNLYFFGGDWKFTGRIFAPVFRGVDRCQNRRLLLWCDHLHP